MSYDGEAEDREWIAIFRSTGARHGHPRCGHNCVHVTYAFVEWERSFASICHPSLASTYVKLLSFLETAVEHKDFLPPRQLRVPKRQQDRGISPPMVL